MPLERQLGKLIDHLRSGKLDSRLKSGVGALALYVARKQCEFERMSLPSPLRANHSPRTKSSNVSRLRITRHSLPCTSTSAGRGLLL